jgi:hypothetical protein
VPWILCSLSFYGWNMELTTRGGFVSPTLVNYCVFSAREQMVNDALHDVFYLDSLPSSHPISTVIDNPTFQASYKSLAAVLLTKKHLHI